MSRGPRSTLTRRAVVAAIGAACARRTLAQKRGRVFRIGIVGLAPTTEIEGAQPRSPQVARLLRALRQMGYVYGEHYVTLAYGVTGHRLPMDELAVELVREKPDVIVATGAAVAALKAATKTIPIVMTASLDPIGMGLVPSLVKPGGNLTGLSLQATEATAKRLELLKDAIPDGGAVAVVWNTTSVQSWRAAQSAAQQRNWRLASVEIDEAKGWEAAFQAAASAKSSGVLVLAAQVLFARAKSVSDMAAKLRLPAMYELRPYVDAGGLMCYGPDITDIWHRAAGYVDKILDGAKPADLPIEQPTRFEFVINLRAARELGLSVPQSMLLRADEVIG